MMDKRQNNKVMRFVLVMAALLCLMVLFLPIPVGAQSVTVSVDAPASVEVGAYFTAQVDISQVTDFDAADFNIVFDSSVLEIEDITPDADITDGQIDGTTVPVASTVQVSPGVVKIVVNIPGFTGASGSGYLCQIRFHAIGASGSSSTITFQDYVLGDVYANAIPANWIGDSVLIGAGSCLPGDANGDGNLNALDISKIELIVAEIPPHYPPASPCADCYQDGKYNSVDITCTEIRVVEAE